MTYICKVLIALELTISIFTIFTIISYRKIIKTGKACYRCDAMYDQHQLMWLFMIAIHTVITLSGMTCKCMEYLVFAVIIVINSLLLFLIDGMMRYIKHILPFVRFHK